MVGADERMTDVIKTRVQSQQALVAGLGPGAVAAVVSAPGSPERRPLLASGPKLVPVSAARTVSSSSSTSVEVPQRQSTLAITVQAYREGGMSVFFRGLGICSVRAFVVNAVQWAVYEWVMVVLMRENKRQDV